MPYDTHVTLSLYDENDGGGWKWLCAMNNTMSEQLLVCVCVCVFGGGGGI